MEAAEFFVVYVQCFLPTWFVRLLVALYMRYVGPRMRSGDCVVQQIRCDRSSRGDRPVTTLVEDTNEQLYGNDPAFFVAHLGPRLKYSASEWPPGVASIAAADTYTIRKY